jgi:hypothetical protein
MVLGFRLPAEPSAPVPLAKPLYQPVELTLKGALDLPSFYWSGSKAWNNATQMGIGGGAWAGVDFNLRDDFGIQVEFGYAGRGCKIDGPDGELNWVSHYLELPVWAFFRYADPNMAAYIGIGAYLALFLGGSYDFNVPGSEFTGQGSLATGDTQDATTFRSWDYGLLFTLGFEYQRFIFELRVPLGLAPVVEFTPANKLYGGFRSASNAGLAIAIGYHF